MVAFFKLMVQFFNSQMTRLNESSNGKKTAPRKNYSLLENGGNGQ
jgi:hypothetical protein